MAKKTKTKEQKHNIVPTNWIGKSVDQLKELVDQLQCDLEKARKSRNKAQTEFASIQSYCDVTRENIRELDMRIEKQDIEVENVQEDNDTELKVFEQKSNFVKYCHDEKLKQTTGETDARIKESVVFHANQVEKAKASKTELDAERDDLEKRLLGEYSSTRNQHRDELSHVREKLDADVRLFEQKCDTHQSLFKEELIARRTSELHAIESRKDSHLQDVTSSHERACSEMRSYFDGVERQQSIDIEELQAQIRRLRKVAVKNESNSNKLKESNRIHGEKLQICSGEVTNLKAHTKDMEKDRTSLSAANARLSATRKAIRQTRAEYIELQEKVASAREEIVCVKNQTKAKELKSSDVVSCNAVKRAALQESMERQQKKNESVDQHRSHVVVSAGLTDSSNELTSNICDFVHDTNQEIERLSIKIAQATQKYTNDFNQFRTELTNRGASAEKINSLNAVIE